MTNWTCCTVPSVATSTSSAGWQIVNQLIAVYCCNHLFVLCYCDSPSFRRALILLGCCFGPFVKFSWVYLSSVEHSFELLFACYRVCNSMYVSSEILGSFRYTDFKTLRKPLELIENLIFCINNYRVTYTHLTNMRLREVYNYCGMVARLTLRISIYLPQSEKTHILVIYKTCILCAKAHMICSV